MGNDFLYMFLMFNVMNDKDRPIPLETMLSSMDMVPAPLRFMMNATAIQNCEADCAVEDDNLRTQLFRLVQEKKITPEELQKYPRVAAFLKPIAGNAIQALALVPGNP
jgi:hypothetical protein